MAIYRGTGGSSTTTDETTINAVNQKAAEAATSASNAASSASDASTSASTANTKATQASTSATNAAASASSASQSANTATTAKDAALAAQVAAEIAEAEAESAESNAILYGNMANTAAADAIEARTFAEAAETSAQTYAAAALSSANDASSYDAAVQANATAAAASEAAAEASELAAAASETAAASSATEANASAVAAASSESAVAANATAAATSESNAAASESAAATSESNASASATAAANSASEASASASAASTSETNAAASESAAASSATSASASADAALAALDSFDDRYLGQKASDPTVDNDGNALVAGALYFNTTDDIMKVYDGSTWVAAYASLSGALLQNNNLSDLANVTSARTNLGLGTAATTASTDYATAAQGALADSALQSIPDNYILNTGDSITGNLNFGDNDKAIFGAGSDLQIWSNGDTSYIVESSTTGNLEIRATDVYIKSGDNAKVSAVFDSDGQSKLYYDGSPKLATTSTGIDVTGTATMDGLTVDGTIFSSSTVRANVGTASTPNFTVDGGAGMYKPTSNVVGFSTSSTQRMRLADNGDISFYEDTGTTAKFFWDASAESLGIGTSSPASEIDVVGASGGNGEIKVSRTSGASILTQAQSALGKFGTSSNHNLQFMTNGGGRMTIDTNGNVGIGTSSPQAKLQVLDNLKVSTADQSSGSVILGDGSSTNFNVGLARWNGSTNSAGTGGVGYFSQGPVNGGGHYFYTGDAQAGSTTERMRIDSSGNVGIGTASPTADLSVGSTSSSSGDVHLRTSKTAFEITPSNSDAGGVNLGVGWVAGGQGPMKFSVGASERMRIDSSGNLLVGKTALSRNVAGAQLEASGAVTGVVDGGVAGYFNRQSTDGDIVQFRKDGTTVGSIGTTSGKLYVDLGNWVVSEDASGNLMFATGGTNKMKLDASGNLSVVGDVAAYATL